MLIKDLEIGWIERTTVNSTGTQEPVIINDIKGKVIIKRNNKFYAVPLVKSGENLDFYMMMAQFLFEAEKIDSNWIVIDHIDYEDVHGCKILIQEEIKL